MEPLKPSSPRARVTPDDVILVAQMVQRMRVGADLRRSMIRRMREAIRNQEYENPLKLDIAADRVADVLECRSRPGPSSVRPIGNGLCH
jgi:hypothetical protein